MASPHATGRPTSRSEGGVQSRDRKERGLRRNLAITIGFTLAVLSAACGSGASNSPTPASTSPPAGVTGGAGTIIRPSGSAPPTASPGITGSVTHGAASLTLTGDINETVSLDRLTGAVWAPPPAGMALTWTGAKAQSLSIAGPSFTSQVSTSAAQQLSFSVLDAHGTLVRFDSSAGECLVTIDPALPDHMGGLFICRSIRSGDGATTVSAQGTFSATG